MPIYEFYCPDNNKIYSFYARTLAHGSRTPRCPDNPKFRMERLVSSFSVTGRAKEKPEMPSGDSGADDPRMEAAFAEMEREFGSMDMENPDPRRLAHMMRKMSALTGEKVPGQMEEMLSRMEAGEDPETLDEEYGDVMDEMDAAPEGAAEGDAANESVESRKRLKEQLRRLGKRPVRDATLYEMSDFLE